ncbi:MAG TPA: putative Ig domain-containing protein [Acidimicrobiales bacterium]|nr:putative Ig domain-containing protein [Acidimicrobiales bacterium]
MTPTAIAVSDNSAYVIGSDGNVYAWGYGPDGELGDGSTPPTSTPVKVSLPARVTPTAIAAGGRSAYVIASDGNVYAWGYGPDGELGNGSMSDGSTPVKVTLPAGVTATAIAAGDVSAFAIGSDGNLYAWGSGTDGELGNGSTSDSSTPVEVSLPAGVTPSALGPEPGSSSGYVVTVAQTIVLGVSGYQTYGSSGPSFNLTSYPPAGTTLSGTLVCTTVDGGTAISATLPAGSHALDGDSCSGLSLSGGYAVAYYGGPGSFLVSQAAQTISFTSTPPSPAFVGDTYDVSASATSGLAVSFSIAPVDALTCSISGTTVTFNALGTCVIDAAQAGDTDYSSAPEAQQVVTVSAPPANGTANTNIYPVPTVWGLPWGITTGPDGNLWFTEEGGDNIGEIDPSTGAVTEYPVPTPAAEPEGITVGPDGNIWFTEEEGDNIGELDPATATPSNPGITEYPLPNTQGPSDITTGPDGNLWFTTGLSIGELNLSDNDAISEWAVPNAGEGGVLGITAGPDGNVWFADEAGDLVGNINPSTDLITEYTVPTANAQPFGITVGPDGNIWFTEYNANQIGELDLSDNDLITEYPVRTPDSGPSNITTGPDGNIWFTEATGNNVGEIDPATATPSDPGIIEYADPNPAYDDPNGITAGPDGNIWFTDTAGDDIGQLVINTAPSAVPITVDVSGSQTYLSGPTFNYTSDAPSGVNISGELTCSTVNGGISITPLVDVGTYTVDGSSCSGLTVTGSSGYVINYVGEPGGFVVSPFNVVESVSGSEVYGDPGTLTLQGTETAGIVIYGNLICTAVYEADGSTLPIGSSPPLPAGTYTVDAASCGGGTVPGNYTLSYLGVPDGFVVSQAPQTISFSSVNPSPVGVGASYTPAASATSGLTVGFSIDTSSTAGACSLNAGVVSFTGAGSCLIDASQAGNANYSAAPPVQQTVQVVPLPAFSSAATLTVPVGTAFSVPVTATGPPAPTLSESGTLPAGVTFTAGAAGTATLAGTSSVAPGVYNFNFIATNAIGDTAQNFTLTIGQAPAITSAGSDSAAPFAVGSAGSFTVTTTGSPLPALTESGQLPTGVNFNDNGDGTATISGTPATGTAGAYPITITASNGVSPDAYQNFTLTIDQPQAITFTGPSLGLVGTPATLSATGGASGSPVAFTVDFTSGAGVCNVSGTNGTTLNYTAAGMCVIDANQAGSGYYLPAPQVQWAVTVDQPPAFTSAATYTTPAGTAFSFPVGATGSPVPTLSESGTLPAGATFTAGTAGTATLAGTASVPAGVYTFTLSAVSNAGSTTQAFMLTVTAPPSFTSASSTTCTVGQPASFMVMALGTPTPTLSESGTLPVGVTFTPGPNGTATLAGNLSSASEGTFPLTISAANSVATVNQAFTLTVVSGTLLITSAASTTFTAGAAGTFTVTATGTPTPTLSESGALPSGVSFKAGSAGTATLAGTPVATAKGIYPVTFTASSTAGKTSQAFTLTVDQVPSLTSAATVTETAGAPFSFAVTATGYPAPTLTGASLPGGVSFSGNGNGTGTLSGTTAVAAGTYQVTVAATNAAGMATQAITLTVKAAGPTETVPTFTSAATATATAGTAFTFTVTTAGSPTTYATNLAHRGALPPGVSFSNKGNGTASLSGTPTAASGGQYAITFKATNAAGTTTQSFVMTVDAKPAITSAANSTATVGATYSFTVKATGYPPPALSETGTLPTGFSFVDNGNSTATISGTPGTGAGGVYTFTIWATSSAGTGTQTFTLTVRQPPLITSAPSATATHGTSFTFTFTASGYPLPTFTHSGAVAGLTWSAGSGELTLSGTPKTAGIYTLTVTASNSSGKDTQTFTLTVN